MRIGRHTLRGLAPFACALAMAGAAQVFGQGAQELNRVPNGEEVKKFRGIVVKRDADWFTMAPTTGGRQTVVLLSSSTEVKSHKKGVFRGSKEYESSYILRGLRLEVDGVGNAEGQLVADKIRFDEQDLRTAQALKSAVDPVEAEMREKLKQQQAEQERLAGELAETNAVVEANRAEARAEAARAQAAAEEAQAPPTTRTTASTASTTSTPSRTSSSTSRRAAPPSGRRAKRRLTTPPRGSRRRTRTAGSSRSSATRTRPATPPATAP